MRKKPSCGTSAIGLVTLRKREFCVGGDYSHGSVIDILFNWMVEQPLAHQHPPELWFESDCNSGSGVWQKCYVPGFEEKENRLRRVASILCAASNSLNPPSMLFTIIFNYDVLSPVKRTPLLQFNLGLLIRRGKCLPNWKRWKDAQNHSQHARENMCFPLHHWRIGSHCSSSPQSC